MTMTMNAPAPTNGKPQRKNLSTQIDRLDAMLDGLDQGLQGAITDAVKDAVSVAVVEAVRATVMEIVTNPDVIALLRGSITPEAPRSIEPQQTEPIKPQQMEPKPSLVSRIRERIGDKLKRLKKAITSPVRTGRDKIVKSYQKVNAIWKLKKPMLIALGIGVVSGVVGYTASPWFAGILSGIGSGLGAMGVQLAMWLRKMYALPFGKMA